MSKRLPASTVPYTDDGSPAVPVARAADDKKPGNGRITISENDPCLIVGHGTKFKDEALPRWQIQVPKAAGSLIAEITEIISDTELRIKKEFGGEGGKGTARVQEKIAEAKSDGKEGLEYSLLPFVDQQEMYRFVYQRLKEGGCIGIFPEGVYATPSLVRGENFDMHE